MGLWQAVGRGSCSTSDAVHGGSTLTRRQLLESRAKASADEESPSCNFYEYPSFTYTLSTLACSFAVFRGRPSPRVDHP
jgi:hypothetical protein